MNLSMKKILMYSFFYVFGQNKQSQHIHVLDGWRGLSILFVLAAHLLPLGSKNWQMNETVGALGMSLFFILSGFLISNFLYKKQNIVDFLIRRLFRILPLAWLYIIIALFLKSANETQWLTHLFFVSNWPPMHLTNVTSHFWSLCVEVQFYLLVALLVLFFRKRGLLILPLICLAVTWYRIDQNVYVAINTYYRLDEILAGCTLSLIYNNEIFVYLKRILSRLNPYLIFTLLFISCHPQSGDINYLRPYFAAILIGVTLFNKNRHHLNYFLNINVLFYLATISYALYIIHGGLRFTWLGEGDTLVKYAKRPLLFTATFLLAHLSTFYYEKYFIKLGRTLSSKINNHD